MEDAFPTGNKGVTVAFENLEEAVQGHSTDLNIGRGLRSQRGFGLRGERDENLSLHALLKVVPACRDVLGRNDEDLVEDFGGLETDGGRRDGVMLDEEEVGGDKVPAHSRFAVDEAMNVEERDDAEL